MFGWLKKANSPPAELPECFKNYFDSMAMAVVIVDETSRYARSIQLKQIIAPAFTRKDCDAVTIWEDTLIEAFIQLKGRGASDIGILADRTKQPELLAAFENEKPHLSPPALNQDVMHDTWQAIYEGYRYLGKVGEQLCDRETCPLSLSLAKKRISDDFERNMTILRGEWHNNKSNALFYSKTVFDLLLEDFTKKAKSIGLSAKFGPCYETIGETLIADVLTEKSEEEKQDFLKHFNQSIRVILEAKSPDEARQKAETLKLL